MTNDLPTLALKGLEGNARPELGVIQTWIVAHYDVIQLLWWTVLGIVIVTLAMKLVREYLAQRD